MVEMVHEMSDYNIIAMKDFFKQLGYSEILLKVISAIKIIL